MPSTSTATTSPNKIYCLVGPSGTGKDAIAHKLGLPRVISYRTREPREGEIDGVHGHFITKEEFLEMDKQGMWIAKTFYAGHYYGITQGELLPLEDSSMVYVIDWAGVLTLKDTLNKLEGYSEDEVVSIFVHTPREDLEARMLHRKGMSRDEIKVRLDRADRDYAAMNRCDHVVVNPNELLNYTISNITEIILRDKL